ncbi:recombinase family protein [Arthrobacter sp. I2-34]|uniref:Recombinase family protein n=1 Tax=Arthrobacter hankyongi TaxID=2904801 RepID=A0ABS9L7Q8_9MICC|nr:recombinase family protein [Arthrobacter hankyongi]MCG2622703.1 recombinase family protein [Arthrobacter hankyongi]
MSPAVQSCAVYVRISRDDEGTALGVARQLADCTAEAERRGWPVAQVFEDNDVSATKTKVRPEYARMLQAIEVGVIDAVIVWDVDRLTRTPAELERFIDLADRHRLALASIGGEVDLATPQGRLTARIKGSVATA